MLSGWHLNDLRFEKKNWNTPPVFTDLLALPFWFLSFLFSTWELSNNALMHRDILCSRLISLHATKVWPLMRKRTLTHIHVNERMKNGCSSRSKRFQISFERPWKNGFLVWGGSIIGGRTFRKPPYFVPSKQQTSFVFFKQPTLPYR